MSNRVFVTLLLSSQLAFPAIAQQTNSPLNEQDTGSAAQTASGPQSGISTDREPLPSSTPKDYWDGDEPNLVNIVTHPFATKKYVQRQVGPIRERINELDQLTSENRKTIGDEGSRAQQGIQLASEKIGLAEQHAIDASNRAQIAHTSAAQAATRISTAEQTVSNLDQYKEHAKTEIHFRAGHTVMGKAERDALDEMAAALKNQHSYIIEVRGFAPGRGQVAIASSQKMVHSIVRYLVLNHEIPLYRIYAMSMGNAGEANGDGSTTKHITGGRVEVDLLKNDQVSSAQY